MTREEATRRNTMQNELRECPFCGGEAEIIPFDRKALGVWKFHFFYVQCRLCSNGTHVFTYEIDAIEAWNRRVSDE